MFARFIELTVKPEKKSELFNKLTKEVVPILKKYSGFRDVINLELETDPAKVYLISLWHDKQDAQRYQMEDFDKVKAIYEPFLTTPVVVRLCAVNETSFVKEISVAA